MNLGEVLSRIRGRVLELAATGWPELEPLADSIFPNPLSPSALLPIATGQAVGGHLEPLVRAAAALQLLEKGMHIVDDCADDSDERTLHRRLGCDRAMNLALTFHTLGIRELESLPLAPRRRAALMNDAFPALLEICNGRDLDMLAEATSLEAYQAVVERKSVATCEWSATVGAMVGTDHRELLARCARCGGELGWMGQILRDLAAVFFPEPGEERRLDKPNFPILLGMSLDHPSARTLSQRWRTSVFDRPQICALLDELDVRQRLVTQACEHRDRALAALGPLQPTGLTILERCLDGHLHDVTRLLGAVQAQPS